MRARETVIVCWDSVVFAMLPIEVKIVSSTSCSLSEASALLQRFLSSDACSDSFARDYVAHVAQGLQDTISRRSGGPESRSKHSTHLRFPGRGDDEKLRAEDVGQDADVCMSKSEHALGRSKKKRRHSALEMTSDTFLMDCDKKRRKKEKHETETEGIGPDDQNHHDRNRSKEKQEMETKKVVIEYPVFDYQSKKKRKKEKQGKNLEDMEPLHVSENRGSPVFLLQAKRKVDVSSTDASHARMSGKVDNFAGSSKRKQKAVKTSYSATPLKNLSLVRKREETDIKVSTLEFEDLASEEKNITKKKRRRKEEVGELVRQTRIDGTVDF